MDMNWQKKGLIFNAVNLSDWQQHTALQPSPIIIGDKIRVFCGFRDEGGISRIGFVDVDAENPTKILGYSNKPVLDIGQPGAFDDNGVVPCAVVQRGKKIYMYYAGYNLGLTVRFKAFSGLAISEDGGQTFHRYQNNPVMERTNREFLFRAIHSILKVNGHWKVWYGGGNEFIKGKEKTLPVYNIRYTESPDGIDFTKEGEVIIDIEDDMYRVGRPYVIKHKEYYEMFYGYSSEDCPYRLTYATSEDGKNWTENRKFVELNYGKGEFDEFMSAYPSVIYYKNNYYMFYNGNFYGREGFGLAILKTN